VYFVYVAYRSAVFKLDRKTASADEVVKLENSYLTATVSAATGLLQEMSLKNSDVTVKTDLSFVQYGTRPGKERSGAYLFLPDGDAKVGRSCFDMQILCSTTMSLEQTEITCNLEHLWLVQIWAL